MWINSLNLLGDKMKIIRGLPKKVINDIHTDVVKVHSMPTVSWSNVTYYLKQVRHLFCPHFL